MIRNGSVEYEDAVSSEDDATWSSSPVSSLASPKSSTLMIGVASELRRGTGWLA